MSKNRGETSPLANDSRQSEGVNEEARQAQIRRQVETARLIRQFLSGALLIPVVIPLLFYLEFGTCDRFCIGFTIFLEVMCLLIAFGFYFKDKTDFHSKVALREGHAGKFLDRVGAFWLVACAFGPLFGYVATATVFTLTERNWKWLYGIRIFLAVLLPILTLIPLLRYARGKAALVALPLLAGITALPVWSGWWAMRDFKEGAKTAGVVVAEKHTDSASKYGGTLTCKFKDDPTNRISFDVRDLRPYNLNQEIEIVYLPHTVRVLAVR